MAQNDPTFAAGDRVNVYESGALAALAEAGHLANDGNPKAATIVREHPSEPGCFQVEYDDGGTEFVTDTLRFRKLAAE